jgi:hypothetical protein
MAWFPFHCREVMLAHGIAAAILFLPSRGGVSLKAVVESIFANASRRPPERDCQRNQWGAIEIPMC